MGTGPSAHSLNRSTSQRCCPRVSHPGTKTAPGASSRRRRSRKSSPNRALLMAVLVLPRSVLCREAGAARAVPGGDRRRFAGEEDPMPHVAARRDGAQRGGAVEAAVDPGGAMAAEGAGDRGPVRLSIGAKERVARPGPARRLLIGCLLYTSDAADDLLCVDLGGR